MMWELPRYFLEDNWISDALGEVAEGEGPVANPL